MNGPKRWIFGTVNLAEDEEFVQVCIDSVGETDGNTKYLLSLLFLYFSLVQYLGIPRSLHSDSFVRRRFYTEDMFLESERVNELQNHQSDHFLQMHLCTIQFFRQ